MKMYALYDAPDLPKLEYNHRKYCDKHKIEYNKILYSGSLSEKYSYILACLQKNIGNVLFFIDNFSFFKTFDILPELKEDMFIQKDKEKIFDNFFIVKSNQETIRIFEEALHSINQIGFFGKDWKKAAAQMSFPSEKCLAYPHQEKTGQYVNISLSRHSNAYEIGNVLVVNFIHHHQENEGNYFAEVACSIPQKQYSVPLEKYECFNPGQKTAFVTLYTPNIENLGIISEENIKKYCIEHSITYHIYRDTTNELKKENISGTWAKPWLLFNHFYNHENIIWIDSDILLSKNYKIETSLDIAVYKDPVVFFNAGYMFFKTNEKNKDLLNCVIKKLKQIDGVLEGVYNHGGDQPRFIEAVKEFYPEYSPLSSTLGNMHPVYPISVSPYRADTMIHFMGFDKNLRCAIMAGYNEILISQYETSI